MARPKDHTKHVSVAVEDLLGAVARLATSVQDAVAKSREVRVAATGVKVSATETGKKIGSAVKAAWARMSPKARAARVRKMHAWRRKR